MNSRRTATASGRGHRVGVRDEHELAGRRARARVRRSLRSRRLRVLDHTHSERVRRRGARRVRDHDELVHLRRERRERLSELPRWPCDTTTAETFTPEHLEVDGDGAARRLLPRESRARSSPRGDQPVALGSARRTPSASRSGSTKTAASPATSRRAGSRRGDDRRPAGHRLEHRQAEALVARRHHEARGAAVELGELVLVT